MPIFDNLVPEFADLMHKVIDNCAAKGIIMVPRQGFRSLEDQAKLWRQGRSTRIINEKIKTLRIINCGYLANVIESVGPQNGPLVTHALPGYSAHNFGEAMDCYLKREGKIEMGPEDVPLYEPYAQEAKALGLNAGYFWKKQDASHIQLHQEEITSRFNIQELNNFFMRKAAQKNTA